MDNSLMTSSFFVEQQRRTIKKSRKYTHKECTIILYLLPLIKAVKELILNACKISIISNILETLSHVSKTAMLRGYLS